MNRVFICAEYACSDYKGTHIVCQIEREGELTKKVLIFYGFLSCENHTYKKAVAFLNVSW